MFFLTALLYCALVAYHLDSGGVRLYDAVGVNCKMGAITDINAQVLSIWAKGHMFYNRLCII